MKYLLVFTLLILPIITFADGLDYVPIAGIPGVPASGDFDTLIDSLYFLSISIAALLAVIKIVIAGVKYMLSDIVTNKSAAKSDITSALIGLLVVLGAVLILNVINPNLTRVNLQIDNQGVATIDNATGAETYNPALVSGRAVGGSSIDYLTPGRSPETIEAFRQNCAATSGRFYSSGAETVRCLRPGSNQNLRRFENIPNTREACTAVGGAFIPDGEDFIWCSSPQ